MAMFLLVGITAIAAGNDYTIALKNDGTAWSWYTDDSTAEQIIMSEGLLTGIVKITQVMTTALRLGRTVRCGPSDGIITVSLRSFRDFHCSKYLLSKPLKGQEIQQMEDQQTEDQWDRRGLRR
ncbi:hypothetical protein BK133_22770 [Paenibacillus sp. FSL H8-0548]|uniref:RCC1 domain-containing protein n=1 Tax=Paenibacillus sp. FSL H8-0548 TaxID=1920422 RepID=UPI00096DFC94|nr:RCC1 domain-containing protein [Paenibacillus sp. FSL H8-0548]OMF24544.1 hypothetical protein BK133_22770 [Paenibacillus sp. FSL H8-0548]